MQPDACLSPPSEVLLSPPRFPILTLDEAKLTPALGYLFDRKWIDPYESLVSVLWKFQKANALSGKVVANLMGPDIDPYEGIVPELGVVDIDRLHGALCLPKTTLRDALLAPTERRRFSATFRHCRRCIAHGYHSVVHQVETVYRCPAHRDALESACLHWPSLSGPPLVSTIAFAALRATVWCFEKLHVHAIWRFIPAASTIELSEIPTDAVVRQSEGRNYRIVSGQSHLQAALRLTGRALVTDAVTHEQLHVHDIDGKLFAISSDAQAVLDSETLRDAR
ncbi:hypothetical protein [Cupriavidus necator]